MAQGGSLNKLGNHETSETAISELNNRALENSKNLNLNDLATNYRARIGGGGDGGQKGVSTDLGKIAVNLRNNNNIQVNNDGQKSVAQTSNENGTNEVSTKQYRVDGVSQPQA